MLGATSRSYLTSFPSRAPSPINMRLVLLLGASLLFSFIMVKDPIKTIGEVSLSWDGIPNPHEGDYISVYNPPYNPGLFGPQGIEIYSIEVKNTPSYLMGMGKTTVRLANLRTEYNFGYWSRGQLVALSHAVPVAVEYPSQGHLAVDENNRIIVQWADSNYDSPVVYYGSGPANLSSMISANSYTYGIQDMMPCAINGTSIAIEMFRDPGVLHAATMPLLPPNKPIYYKFGADAIGFSQVFSFESPPEIRSDQPTILVTYADMGTSLCLDPIGGWCGIGVKCVVDYLAKEINSNISAYDGLIHVGDLSYAVARAYRWDMWMNEIEPIAAKVPYMVELGNHEFDYVGQHFFPSWSNFYNDSDGECGVPTRKRFVMPWGDSDWWYSYDVGNVHIVMLTFEQDFRNGTAQYEWFINDVKNVNRSKTPWLVVTGHRPFYSSGVSGEDHLFSRHIRDALEEPFLKFKVDLFLTGHYHNYERSCAVYQEKCVSSGNAPVHVLVGTAGIELEHNWMEPQPSWSMKRGALFGHAKITTYNATTLRFEMVACEDGSVFDEFYIRK